MGHAMSDRKKPVHRNRHVHRRGHHDRLGAYGRAANESGPFTGGGRRLTMTSGGGPSLIATETSSRINRTSHEAEKPPSNRR